MTDIDSLSPTRRGTRRVRLTDTLVGKLPVPKAGSRIVKDNRIRGFGVRITAAGARSFVLNYTIGCRERRITIGSFPAWPTLAALDEAKRLKRDVEQGVDPFDKRNHNRIERQRALARASGRVLPKGIESAAQVYRHFNQDGELLYVGAAMNGFQRLLVHRDKSFWFREIAVVTIQHFATREEALEAENLAIASENPRYNVSGGLRISAMREKRNRAKLSDTSRGANSAT